MRPEDQTTSAIKLHVQQVKDEIAVVGGKGQESAGSLFGLLLLCFCVVFEFLQGRTNAK